MVTINAPTVTPILGSLKVTCLRGIELRAGQGIFYLFSCIELILVNKEIVSNFISLMSIELLLIFIIYLIHIFIIRFLTFHKHIS